MKKQTKLILLFFISNIVFCQNGKITYKIAISLSTEKTAPDVKVMMDKIIKHSNSQKFELIFNKETSYFNIISKISDLKEEDQYIANVSRSGFTSKSKIYTDKQTNSIFEVMEDGIIIKSNINDVKWQITNDTKLIDTYNCYKALLPIEYLSRNGDKMTRIVTVWFAPSLPYGFGPKTYNGLPGLILELTDKQTTYIATSVKLTNQETKINLPKGKTISKTEYENKLKENMGTVITRTIKKDK